MARQSGENQPVKDSWNADIFVQIVLDAMPQLQWKDVIRELDHPGSFKASGHFQFGRKSVS